MFALSIDLTGESVLGDLLLPVEQLQLVFRVARDSALELPWYVDPEVFLSDQLERVEAQL